MFYPINIYWKKDIRLPDMPLRNVNPVHGKEIFHSVQLERAI